MAKHLARIHGTEEDKVNCPFYFKIGACRHADRCSRLHHKPAFSPTLLIQHVYKHPLAQNTEHFTVPAHIASPEQQQEDFLCFFEDLYMELSKFGKLEGLHVVDNLGDHMVGHVYVKYFDEEDAADALSVLNGRYYDGRPLIVEYSPVTDFREARCRDYDEEICSRGGYCNFLHVKPVPLPLLRSLEDDAEEDRRRHNQYRGGGNNNNNNNNNNKSGSSKKKRKRDQPSSSNKGGGSSKDRDRSNSSSKRNRRSRSGSQDDGSASGSYNGSDDNKDKGRNEGN